MSADERFRPGAEVKHGGRLEFVVEMDSELTVIEPAVSYLVSRCKANEFEGSRVDLNLRVCVTEALANAILYGNHSDPRKTVRVEVCLDTRQVEVRVIDEGPGFDPAVIPDPTEPDRLQQTGGRGLFLMRRLMDKLEFNERGNALRMVLRRADRSIRRAR